MTEEQVKSVRSHLSSEENGEVDDRMLNQFLRATKQDADKVWQLHYLKPNDCVSNV